MNDIIAIQLTPPIPQQTEKTGRRMDSGTDFSTVLGMAADRQTEAAVSASERPQTGSSRPERAERPDKAERQGRSSTERPDKPEDTKPAEELAAYANSSQSTDKSVPVEEETVTQDIVAAIEDVAPEAAAPVVVEEPVIEVTAQESKEFSNELNKIMSDINSQTANHQVQPEVIENVFQNLMAELNVKEVSSEKKPFNPIDETPDANLLIDEDADGEANVKSTPVDIAPALEDIGDNYEQSQAFIGKNVTIAIPDTTSTVTGQVIDVGIDKDGIFFLIDDGSGEPKKVYPASLNEADIKVNETDSANNIFNVPAAQAAPIVHCPDSVQAVLPELIPNMQNMFQQIAQSARMTTPGTTSQLVIQLYPEHLGKLRIELAADAAGQITARIESGNPAVRALFTAGLADLIDCLRASGIDLKSLEIGKLERELTAADLGHRNLGQNDQNQQNNQSHQFGSNNRHQNITHIPLPPLSGNYDTAVLNSYINDENVSVEFTA